MTTSLTELDRLAMRERPPGRAIMHQSWGKLLFMHWRIDEELLRPLIPSELTIDTFDGSAWIGVVPFTMWDIRAFPPYIPAVPGLNAFHELNVRTYVHKDGEPGVWFFSLDATNAAAVLGARRLYFLPYYHAKIELSEKDQEIDYSSVRSEQPAAEFRATWSIGEELPPTELGSLDFFLTERYCLYSERRGSIYQSRILHQPWPLRSAKVSAYESTMIEALGLETPEGEPLLHYCEDLSVLIWPLKKV